MEQTGLMASGDQLVRLPAEDLHRDGAIGSSFRSPGLIQDISHVLSSLGCDIPSMRKRKQRVQTPLGRGGKQHISSPGMPGLAEASPHDRRSGNLCGEGPRDSTEDRLHSFPEAPCCSVARGLSTREERGCPGDNKHLWLKAQPRRNAEHEMPPRGRDPCLSQRSCSCAYRAQRGTGCLRPTPRNPGGTWLKSRPREDGSVQ